MPSWNESSSSGESMLPHFTAMDYAPATTEDLSFAGIALGSGIVCPVHKLEPVRCVAFEGRNTGRRFYMCQVENEVANCGFVSWHDDQEWPEPLGNALIKLWTMIEESNRARVDERIESGRLLQEVVKEKEKAEKDYASLMQDVNRLFDDSSKQVMQANYSKLTKEKSDMDQLGDELFNTKREKKELIAEVEMLKQVQKSQAEVMKSKQEAWDSEREIMKEEKKKLEYMLYDLVKARDADRDLKEADKEKIKRIKAICDE